MPCLILIRKGRRCQRLARPLGWADSEVGGIPPTGRPPCARVLEFSLTRLKEAQRLGLLDVCLVATRSQCRRSRAARAELGQTPKSELGARVIARLRAFRALSACLLGELSGDTRAGLAATLFTDLILIALGASLSEVPRPRAPREHKQAPSVVAGQTMIDALLEIAWAHRRFLVHHRHVASWETRCWQSAARPLCKSDYRPTGGVSFERSGRIRFNTQRRCAHRFPHFVTPALGAAAPPSLPQRRQRRGRRHHAISPSYRLKWAATAALAAIEKRQPG